MIKLKVNRYLQDPAHCAVASCATIGNYYDEDIDYEWTKELATDLVKDTSEGMDTGEMGLLLNKMGFKKVIIISCNLHVLDYKWANVSRNKLIENLKKLRGLSGFEYRDECNAFIQFLKNNECDNSLVINFNFSKFIRKPAARSFIIP